MAKSEQYHQNLNCWTPKAFA